MNAHFATTIPSYKAQCRLAADYSYVIFYVVKVEKIAIVDSSNMKNPFLFLSNFAYVRVCTRAGICLEFVVVTTTGTCTSL